VLENYLIIVGAQKCGTTTLHSHLATSKYFASSTVKELHYFDTAVVPDIHDYTSRFSESDTSECYLESTPSYLYLPSVPESMNETLLGKNVKIIICIRDPVQRAYSHYQMNVRWQQETDTFDAAFRRMSSDPVDSYFKRGLYSEQIKRYQDSFGDESVLVLEMEKDFKDTRMLNRKLEEFIEAELNLGDELVTLNSSWNFKNRWVAQLFAPKWIRRIGRARILKSLRARIIRQVSATGRRVPSEENHEKLDVYNDCYKSEKSTLEALLRRKLAWTSIN
jgi:hypothetical protein